MCKHSFSTYKTLHIKVNAIVNMTFILTSVPSNKCEKYDRRQTEDGKSVHYNVCGAKCFACVTKIAILDFGVTRSNFFTNKSSYHNTHEIGINACFSKFKFQAFSNHNKTQNICNVIYLHVDMIYCIYGIGAFSRGLNFC